MNHRYLEVSGGHRYVVYVYYVLIFSFYIFCFDDDVYVCLAWAFTSITSLFFLNFFSFLFGSQSFQNPFTLSEKENVTSS